MWAAELSLISGVDPLVRSVQFAIRTAVRAEALALLAGTDAVDELLDARMVASTTNSRQIYDSALAYLRLDRILSTELNSRRGWNERTG